MRIELPQIEPASERHRAEAQRLMDGKTKPPGSLGRLEELAAQLCAIQRRVPPQTDRKRILLFAADHGIVEEGTSAYPQEVTGQMVANFANGGAAISVLARQAGAELEVVDVGVIGAVDGRALNRKVRAGTRNFAREPALTVAEAERAIAVGLERAQHAADSGVNVLALGEMGIGNTASASALLALLTGADAGATVGRGTGLDDAQLARKQAVIARAIARHRPQAQTPFDALCAVGGLEIAALVGAMIGAAADLLPVVIDGFICTVAALAATRIAPPARDALLFAHRSAETGHRLALEALDAAPLLDLNMRLGEGSGAALALPLIEASARLLREMASFEQAGVSTKRNP
ncbi:MAG TPA: nicotinate-nucleotide--dimethylbenzimidazole phosphoribosyltransferase [Chthonomonadaceae bacterium]|nr:nicotinate-nucleotide--dimethylbenzimidazole phosphoribosyltransferase [Chthonomonadaceae bacterium]